METDRHRDKDIKIDTGSMQNTGAEKRKEKIQVRVVITKLTKITHWVRNIYDDNDNYIFSNNKTF
jgi:hypothetical protein